MATKPMRGRTRLWQFSFEPDVLASAPHLNLPFSPVQSGQFYQNFTTPPWQPMLSSTTFLWSKTFLLSKFYPPCFGSPCFFEVQHSFHQKHSFYQNFPPPFLAAHAFNDSGYQGSSATLPDLSVKSPCFYTISRFERFMVYPNTCFQWFRFKVPFIKNRQPMLSMVLCLRFLAKASSATLPDLSQDCVGSPCFQVQEQPATSQHHAKHQANSPATLPIYCFQSTIPNRGRVTQHAIQPNIAPKPANAPRRCAVKETRPHNTPKNLDTVFCEPYPTTLSINDAEI